MSLRVGEMAPFAWVKGRTMRGFGRFSVASCVALVVACAAALPTASAGGSATVAKSACAGAKAKLAKDRKHHASKARLKKDRKRVSDACKKKHGGGGTGGGGTGGGGTCTVVYTNTSPFGDGSSNAVNFRCTAVVSSFTVTTNKTLTGEAFGRGSGPNNPFSCTTSAHSFTCTGPSAKYYDLETGFNSSDDCAPFTGTVTVNGKDYPFQGDCSAATSTAPPDPGS